MGISPDGKTLAYLVEVLTSERQNGVEKITSHPLRGVVWIVLGKGHPNASKYGHGERCDI
jgi:hypothetical protein